MNADPARTAIETALAWRYATKRFDPTRIIPDNDWRALEHALRMSPSSFGLQPWRFIVVKNQSVRSLLQGHSWNQPQITEASHLVVLAASTSVNTEHVDSFLTLLASERGLPLEEFSQYRERILNFLEHLTTTQQMEAWTARQTYLALGTLLTTAAVLRIDACPLEGIDPRQYDSTLELERQGYATKVACALGYRAANDLAAANKKVRYPHNQVFSYIE